MLKTLCFTWTSKILRIEENSIQVNLLISKQVNGSKLYPLNNVRTLKKLALPPQTVDRDDLIKFKHLRKIPFAEYNNVITQILNGLNGRKLDYSWWL